VGMGLVRRRTRGPYAVGLGDMPLKMRLAAVSRATVHETVDSSFEPQFSQTEGSYTGGPWETSDAMNAACRRIPATERRRSRTYPAVGYTTSPVLKTGWATGPMPLRA
jgi:hypothetical protein